MRKTTILLLILAAVCILPLFAGQRPDSNEPAAEPNDNSIVLVDRLELRIRRLEREVRRLGNEVRVLQRDNRHHKRDIDALNRRLDSSGKDSAPSTDSGSYSPRSSSRARRRMHRVNITKDEDGNVDVDTHSWETNSRRRRVTAK